MADTRTHSHAGTAASRFLDPRVLARIDNLELIARTVMQGFVGGAHPAAKLGMSTDFAAYRGYVPGDDVRRVDWRVYGRTDKLFIKTYEADSNADLVLALDVSASMAYGSDQTSKFDYARMAVASLAYLGASQRDRVAFAALGQDVREFIAPSGRHRNRILSALTDLRAAGPGNLSEALDALISRLKRRAIVVVFSDFYDEPATLVNALQQFKLRGHEVLVFQVLDPRERDFDLGSIDALEDLESAEVMTVSPRVTQVSYVDEVAGHLEMLARECLRCSIDYTLLDTARPLEHLLFEYLNTRSHQRGRRARRR